MDKEKNTYANYLLSYITRVLFLAESMEVILEKIENTLSSKLY